MIQILQILLETSTCAATTWRSAVVAADRPLFTVIIADMMERW
jgi:hypothetical protein